MGDRTRLGRDLRAMLTGRDEPRLAGVELVRIAILALVLLMAGARLGFAVLSPMHIAAAIVLAVVLYRAGTCLWQQRLARRRLR
jgi:branched-subunit amino acid ABC-type transport system permease component